MRLINTTTIRVENFAPGSIPEYAILSHTWLPEGEVTLQDTAIPEKAKTMPGYSKIAKTCHIARERKIKYACVDTCCIEKLRAQSFRSPSMLYLPGIASTCPRTGI